MKYYPDEYHFFKSKYVVLNTVQKRLAKKLSDGDVLTPHVFRTDTIMVVGFAPRGNQKLHRAVNAQNYTECMLSKDGFLLVTMCMAVSSLWADMEFEDYKEFRSLFQLYILKETPVKDRVNLIKRKESLAILHKNLMRACKSHPEWREFRKMLD